VGPEKKRKKKRRDERRGNTLGWTAGGETRSRGTWGRDRGQWKGREEWEASGEQRKTWYEKTGPAKLETKKRERRRGEIGHQFGSISHTEGTI